MVPPSNATTFVCTHLYIMESDGSCGQVNVALTWTILLSVVKSLATTLALGSVGFYLARAGVMPAPSGIETRETSMYSLPLAFARTEKLRRGRGLSICMCCSS